MLNISDKINQKNLLLGIVLIYDQKSETCDAYIISRQNIKNTAWERRKQQLRGKKRNTTVFSAIRCAVG